MDSGTAEDASKTIQEEGQDGGAPQKYGLGEEGVSSAMGASAAASSLQVCTTMITGNSGTERAEPVLRVPFTTSDLEEGPLVSQLSGDDCVYGSSVLRGIETEVVLASPSPSSNATGRVTFHSTKCSSEKNCHPRKNDVLEALEEVTNTGNDIRTTAGEMSEMKSPEESNRIESSRSEHEKFEITDAGGEDLKKKFDAKKRKFDCKENDQAADEVADKIFKRKRYRENARVIAFKDLKAEMSQCLGQNEIVAEENSGVLEHWEQPGSDTLRDVSKIGPSSSQTKFQNTDCNNNGVRSSLAGQNETQNPCDMKPGIFCKLNVKKLKHPKRKFDLTIDNGGTSSQEPTKEDAENINNAKQSSRNYVEVPEDKRRTLVPFGEISNIVSNKEELFDQKRWVCDTAKDHLLSVNENSSHVTSCDDSLLVKSGTDKKSALAENIWCQMENLCERTQDEDLEISDSKVKNSIKQQFIRKRALVCSMRRRKLGSDSFSRTHPISNRCDKVMEFSQGMCDCCHNGLENELRCSFRSMKKCDTCKSLGVSESPNHGNHRLGAILRSRSKSDSERSSSSDSVCSEDYSSSRNCMQHYRRSLFLDHRNYCCGASRSGPSRVQSCRHPRSYSRSLSPSPSRQVKSTSPDGFRIIKQLLGPLVIPPSMTSLTVAPVTGVTVGGKGNIGGGTTAAPSTHNKLPAPAGGDKPDNRKKDNAGLHNAAHLNAVDKATGKEAPSGTNAHASPPSQNTASTTPGSFRSETGKLAHNSGHPIRAPNQAGENSEYSMQREHSRYDQSGYGYMGYHSAPEPSFSEDASYENFEFYSGEYDFYEDGPNDYNYNNDSYHRPPQQPPGPNSYFPRRPPPQGHRGPPSQMFPPHDNSYGPPRPGMGPPPRMGPNGQMGPRGPRPAMGPRGYRPQFGPGGPMGPPGMRGPPRGSPYGPPGSVRPQGMRGPHGGGMMGPAGQVGPGGPRPRMGPPRMGSPMPRPGSQPPGGVRPRMGPPPSGSLPRDGQYPPPRPGMPPRNPGDPNFHAPVLNLSQPPPNFNIPTASSLTNAAANSSPSIAKAADPVEPPPLPPPKPPTPKPPPPPKKEEEKKEEIKPMTPLIPPEQAEQYRKLREQARKHARKQMRKQEHQAKGEPESSGDDDEEEKAKKKEYESKLAAEQEEMEKVALLAAAQDDKAVAYEEGTVVLMPAAQPAYIQQPAMVIQHHPMSTPPSPYGMMPAPHLVHAAHPSLHASQLQNFQYVAAQAQPQLVQLPNGQVAYASPVPVTYQMAGPMVAVSPQAAHSASMQHHMVMSSAGLHQVPIAAHPGIAIGGPQYMTHMMAAQVQAAQAQAAQVQAAQVQAAQVQAAQAQAAQVQAAQVQAAQAAQVQAAQAAQVQAAQLQAAQMHGFQGVQVAQHVIPSNYPQGQYILVPRVARP